MSHFDKEEGSSPRDQRDVEWAQLLPLLHLPEWGSETRGHGIHQTWQGPGELFIAPAGSSGLRAAFSGRPEVP
jgi:hypothetical protein